mmetsp:Transcript_10986/g.38669  ORF Transcript_10986/g.38669 Transcript_10986/m.38669 type:complete len:240 (-) Transcript_10986:2-721(-)
MAGIHLLRLLNGVAAASAQCAVGIRTEGVDLTLHGEDQRVELAAGDLPHRHAAQQHYAGPDLGLLRAAVAELAKLVRGPPGDDCAAALQHCQRVIATRLHSLERDPIQLGQIQPAEAQRSLAILLGQAAAAVRAATPEAACVVDEQRALPTCGQRPHGPLERHLRGCRQRRGRRSIDQALAMRIVAPRQNAATGLDSSISSDGGLARAFPEDKGGSGRESRHREWAPRTKRRDRAEEET